MEEQKIKETLARRKQAMISAHMILKVEDIFKKCELEKVLYEYEGKDYVVLDELKIAIKMLYKGG